MKKILFSFFALLAFTALTASTPVTGNPDSGLFNDNLSSLEQEFSGLNALEQEVNNRQVTYSDLAAENNPLISNVKAGQDLGAALLGAGAPDDKALGIPGFLWGFCLGLVGILIVYLVIDNEKAKKAQGKKAIIGCIVGGLTWTLLYVIYAALVLSSVE